MTKYIDADKLKSIIKVQIKERKEWMKDIDRSDRQDQLWSDLNGEDMSILQIIDSLQQEQPEVDLEKEIRSMWEKCNPIDEGMGVESTYMHIEAFDIIVRYFFNLGFNARKKD